MSEDAEDADDVDMSLRYEDLEDAFKTDAELPPAFKFLDKYIPDKDDMGQKGRLVSDDMPSLISSLKVLSDFYPELTEGGSPMSESLEDWLDNFEKRLVSVDGKSRDEYKDILEALLSGIHESGEHGDTNGSIMRKLFTTNSDND